MKTPGISSQWAALLAAAALAMGIATPGNAASPVGMEASDAVVVVADVVAIDKADRIVTLVGPDGNVVDIVAGDEVRNFDQIRVGDKVKATYYESIAVYLGMPGAQPDAGTGQVTARAATGEKPAGVVAETVEMSAIVLGIDRAKREVTLGMPGGKVVKTEVDPSVEAFNAVKLNDSIHVRLTRALAIAVEAP